MLKFITNLFRPGVKVAPAPVAPAPYKVEESKPAVVANVDTETAVVPSQTAKKKATVKKATTRKPKTPKAPKA